MSSQHNKLSKVYPVFTNVLSLWISLVPCIPHRPAGSCCIRPPNTSLRNSYETIILFNLYHFQPKVISPTVTHWVVLLGIYAIQMINLLCKHCASSISMFFVSVQEFLCTYWTTICFRKQRDDSEGSQMISAYFDLFDIISAGFTKSVFIA